MKLMVMERGVCGSNIRGFMRPVTQRFDGRVSLPDHVLRDLPATH